MKSLIVALVFLVTLVGCGFKDVNQQIAEANKERFIAFTQGMNAADSEGARIAIAMAYASGMGMQDFFRPETVKDYLTAGVPYILMAERIWGQAYGDDSPRIKAGRDVFIDSTRSDRFRMDGSVFMDQRDSVLSTASTSITGAPEVEVPDEL